LTYLGRQGIVLLWFILVSIATSHSFDLTPHFLIAHTVTDRYFDRCQCCRILMRKGLHAEINIPQVVQIA
jgi:hypothetical protein